MSYGIVNLLPKNNNGEGSEKKSDVEISKNDDKEGSKKEEEIDVETSVFEGGNTLIVNIYLKVRTATFLFMLDEATEVDVTYIDGLLMSTLIALLLFTIVHDSQLLGSCYSFLYWRYLRGISTGNIIKYNKTYTEDYVLEVSTLGLILFIKSSSFKNEIKYELLGVLIHYFVFIIYIWNLWQPMAKMKMILLCWFNVLLSVSKIYSTWLIVYRSGLKISNLVTSFFCLQTAFWIIWCLFEIRILNRISLLCLVRRALGRPNSIDKNGLMELDTLKQGLIFHNVKETLF
jgi:hypothetical protein